MKSTGTKILFSALVLTLAACSGGGGGGGSAVSGDVASPNPTIANPPTAAAGTSQQLADILGADTVANKINQFKLPSVAGIPSSFALKSLSNVKAGDSCLTVNRAEWKQDADADHFLDNASVKATNCEQLTKGGAGSAVFNATLQSNDSNNDSFWANASISFSGNMTYKSETGLTEGEEYYSFKSTLDMSKGALTIHSKSGGYDKVGGLLPFYSASWLTFTATELGVVSVSGYMQEYAEGKGLVTLKVDGTGGQINDATDCIENLNVVVKYANNDVAGTVNKTLCLSTASKAGLK